jgi:DNA (cytosine-5)-methyltransferase 1
MRQTSGSICSGIEGIGMGLAGGGYEPIWFCENDRSASKILAHHYPGVPNLGDLLTTDWGAVPTVDLLTAGFPCQPVSQGGLRKVKGDERWLWPYVADAIRLVRPRRVLLENVPGLLRPWQDDDGWWNPAPIEGVIRDLAQMGFLGRWGSVCASDANMPHRRERIFIVANASGEQPE